MLAGSVVDSLQGRKSLLGQRGFAVRSLEEKQSCAVMGALRQRHWAKPLPWEHSLIEID